MNIKDVARIAGVGVSTVSRVINNKKEVKQETREKIMQVIEDNNYIPNNSARNLKRLTSKTIGILIESGYNPFFYEIINIISSEVQKLGYSMIVQYVKNIDNNITLAKEFIKEKKLTGLIMIGLDFSKASKELVFDMNIPMIVLSSKVSDDVKEYISSVNIDDFECAYKAVSFLVSKGHKDIAIITSNAKDDLCAVPRLRAYKKVLQENGIEFDCKYVEYAGYTFKTGYEAMKKILSNKKRPTAVFVISDIMAVGATKACFDSGFLIPDDISILGVDGIDYSEYYTPSIATVRQPFEEMAREAVNLIMALISGKEENRQVILGTEILERESIKELKR